MIAAGLDPRDVLARAETLAPGVLRWVVITHGAHGATALHVDGQRVTMPAAPARAVDTTGAGDAFAAGLLHGLATRRLPMDRALALASALARRRLSTVRPCRPSACAPWPKRR